MARTPSDAHDDGAAGIKTVPGHPMTQRILKGNDMQVLITDGSGFLGAALSRRLLGLGGLALAGGAPTPITRLTLTDLVPPPDLRDDPRVGFVPGDL